MELCANNDGFKYFPMNTKYVDGSRESVADSHCFRDGIIARSAEDYFFVAEAYIRQGNYSEAAANFNPAKHYLRPLPQAYLNTLQRDGKPLTADEKKAMQNPGY